MGFHLPATSGEGGDGGSGGGGGGGGSGGKRSRKSACPRRIQQSSSEAMDDEPQQDSHSAAAASISEAGASTSGGSPGIPGSPGGDSERRASPPTPPPPPPPPQPPQLPKAPMAAAQLSLQLSVGLEESPDLLRSLATLNPQSIIPSLYSAWPDGASGRYGGGGGGGGGYVAGGDVRRPRGRPKGMATIAAMSGGVPASSPAPPHPSRGVGGTGAPRGSGGGPRPFDPHAVLQPVRIITRKGVAYNRRPRSFYSSEVKLSVIEFAEQHGASAAERQFNIPLSTVQSWMRHENKARILRAPGDPLHPAPAPAAPAFSAATDEQPLNLTAARIPLPSSLGSRPLGGGGGGGGILSPLSLLPLSHRPY